MARRCHFIPLIFQVRSESLVEFGEDLKDGVVLCRFINAIASRQLVPDIYVGPAGFRQRDNVQKFRLTQPL